MSHGEKRRCRRGGHHQQRDHYDKKATADNTSSIDENSMIIQQFLGYQKRLDARHDKHERLVKLSRDVTIDSKRAIFLLQRTTGSEETQSILTEALTKLTEIQSRRWRPICEELVGEDPYQFIRAYSPGLQEYIEALSFYHYLKHGDLISPQAVQNSLQFQANSPETEVQKNDTPADQTNQSETSVQSPDQVNSTEGTNEASTSTEMDTKQICVHIPPMEYMLGIGDLTGELMRVAIHSVGSGDIDKPFKLCQFLRNIYDNFLLFGKINRELNRKLFTLKQSLEKVETACYTLQVRGSEIPKHMLADVLKNVSSSRNEYTDREDITADEI